MKEKSFERKTELTEAALDEFTSCSYEEASLNTIIKKAGISKGTFYYHFTDKQALYLYLLESTSTAKWAFMKSRMAERSGEIGGKSIFDIFKLQARLGLDFIAAYPKYDRLGKMFLKERGNPIYDIAKEKLGGGSEELLDAMIRKAIDSGDFVNEFPEDFIVGVVKYLMLHFDDIFNTDGGTDFAEMTKNLDLCVDFMKRGLGSGR